MWRQARLAVMVAASFMAATLALAEDNLAPSLHEPGSPSSRWTTSLMLDHVRQDYPDGEGNSTSLTVRPELGLSDQWSLSASIPWYRNDGQFLLPGQAASDARICTLLASRPELVERLLATGRLTTQQLAACTGTPDESLSSSASGLGDIEISAVFVARPMVFSTLAALTYKHDSGDTGSGLGSGSREWMFQGSVAIPGSWCVPVVNYSYSHVIRSPGGLEYRNHASAGAGLLVSVIDDLNLSLSYDHQEAVTDTEADYATVTLSGDWYFSDTAALSLFYSRYDEEPALPDTEIGLSLQYVLF